MKVMIDIPKEFEEDLKDNFQDFCNRVIAEITYLLDKEEPLCCGNYERETAEMFLSAFERATVIPDDATNGDMFQILFDIDKDIEEIEGKDGYMYFKISADVWNAPYKKEVE